jgi:hypothetical protein
MKLGIDIGSVTAKVVVLGEADKIIEERYVRTKGQPVETVLAILENLLVKYPPSKFTVAAATGTGGQLIATLLGIPFVSEISAQAAGTAHFHPEVKTILEIGGEDSKLIVLKKSPEALPKVADFATTASWCRTGSFTSRLPHGHPYRPVWRCGAEIGTSPASPDVAASSLERYDPFEQVGTPV